MERVGLPGSAASRGSPWAWLLLSLLPGLLALGNGQCPPHTHTFPCAQPLSPPMPGHPLPPPFLAMAPFLAFGTGRPLSKSFFFVLFLYGLLKMCSPSACACTGLGELSLTQAGFQYLV